MGRELKRVPLDFNWPLNKVWQGYLCDIKAESCPDCEVGLAPEALVLYNKWHGKIPFHPSETGSKPYLPADPEIVRYIEFKINRDAKSVEYYGTGSDAVKREAKRMCGYWNGSWSHHLDQNDIQALIDSNRLCEFTHKWTGEKWEQKNPPYIPIAEEVNRWSLFVLGHDCINCFTVISAKCKRLGLVNQCPTCEGTANVYQSKQDRLTAENWESTEPPAGDGYQLWSTTDEGSPTSPVFDTLDKLCSWAELNATTIGSNRATAQQWKDMLGKGLVYHKDGNLIFI